MLASAVSTFRESLRRAARHARRRVHQQRQRVSHGAASRRRGHRRSRRSSTRVRAPGGELPERARKAGIEVIAHAVVVDTRGTKRVSAVDVMALDTQGADCRRAGAHAAVRPRGGVGRLEPGRAPPCASGRPAAASMPSRRASCRERRCRPSAPPAPPTAASRCTRASPKASPRAPTPRAARASPRAIATWTPTVDDAAEEPLAPLWVVPSPRGIERGPKQFVDLQNDVAASDIVLAAREGYHSIEHVKRYTALGFGTDQGKLGNVNGLAILAQALGNDIASTGTTTFRPNYTPVTIGRDRRPRSRRSVRSRAQDGAARVARGARRAVRERRPVEAAVVLPQAGRGSPRRRGARVPRHAQRRRDHGRVHAGQDRHPGTGRRDVPRLGVHQRVGQARRRPLPLRPHARRERHGDGRRRHDAPRRRSLPDDDHDGRRRARDGVARALAADRMAAARGLPHVGDRSLGDRERGRAPEPRRGARGVRGHRLLARGVSVHGLRAREPPPACRRA